jgi:hypothetical protein
MQGMFMLWRGAQMKPDWYHPYTKHTYHENQKFYLDEIKNDDYDDDDDNVKQTERPMYVKLPGNSSCSQNIKIALNFALKNLKEDHTPVLFAITL